MLVKGAPGVWTYDIVNLFKSYFSFSEKMKTAEMDNCHHQIKIWSRPEDFLSHQDEILSRLDDIFLLEMTSYLAKATFYVVKIR